MTAPRSVCTNTKKALAERGPSIHDEKAVARLAANGAFQRAALIDRSTASLGQQSTLRPADFW